MKISVVMVCVLATLFIQTTYAETENPLVVSCKIRAGEYCSGMPLPLDVTVSNSSEQVVYIYVSNNRPSEIEVKRKGVKKDPKRPLRATTSLSIGSSVPPKSSRSFTYMVNKFISLDLEGEIELSYEMIISGYTLQDEYTIASKYSALVEGEVSVNLGKFDKVRLKKGLDDAMKRLPSDDPLVVLEVAESVCYLDNPIALDYLEKIIETKKASAQFMVIDALKRFSNERSKRLMVELLDPEGHPNVVPLVFELLVAENVKIEGADVQKMLESTHSNIRYNTLTYIKEVGALDYLDLIKPLIEDEDEAVSRLAADMLSAHEDEPMENVTAEDKY